MAKDKKEKKYKSKGGPSRRRYLNRIAKSGNGDTRGEYSKYGDIDPKDVHQDKIATYRGEDVSEEAGGTRQQFSIAVKRGHGKDYFRFSNRLWHITNSYGTNYEEVQV